MQFLLSILFVSLATSIAVSWSANSRALVPELLESEEGVTQVSDFSPEGPVIMEQEVTITLRGVGLKPEDQIRFVAHPPDNDNPCEITRSAGGPDDQSITGISEDKTTGKIAVTFPQAIEWRLCYSNSNPGVWQLLEKRLRCEPPRERYTIQAGDVSYNSLITLEISGSNLYKVQDLVFLSLKEEPQFLPKRNIRNLWPEVEEVQASNQASNGENVLEKILAKFKLVAIGEFFVHLQKHNEPYSKRIGDPLVVGLIPNKWHSDHDLVVNNQIELSFYSYDTEVRHDKCKLVQDTQSGQGCEADGLPVQIKLNPDNKRVVGVTPLIPSAGTYKVCYQNNKLTYKEVKDVAGKQLVIADTLGLRTDDHSEPQVLFKKVSKPQNLLRFSQPTQPRHIFPTRQCL